MCRPRGKRGPRACDCASLAVLRLLLCLLMLAWRLLLVLRMLRVRLVRLSRRGLETLLLRAWRSLGTLALCFLPAATRTAARRGHARGPSRCRRRSRAGHAQGLHGGVERATRLHSAQQRCKGPLLLCRRKCAKRRRLHAWGASERPATRAWMLPQCHVAAGAALLHDGCQLLPGRRRSLQRQEILHQRGCLQRPLQLQLLLASRRSQL